MSGPEERPDDGAGPDDERPTFDWDAIAAELAAGAEADDAAAVEGWDAIAAELAAGLGVPEPGVVDAPSGVPEGVPDVVLGRAPRRPVELEVVPERELPVEEAAPQQELPLEDAEPTDPAALRGGLEALLFVADGPLDEGTLAAALRCPVARVRGELRGLADDYDARRAGMVLRRVGEGWRLYTRDEHAPVVERHLLEGQRNRLTQAALETLAVIAYRQPVTRARVSAIRGVGVDAVVRTLLTRGLVAEAGTDPDTGAYLYVTTPLFLERLGLTGLDELPALAPLVPETRAVLDEHPDV
ncbi:SMC-Scp complex subunit ScpB [Modestobacter sp. NPDC049651]|uniref:SMC-Scp complex subunit ScpB n=1 Tax=unclassified Modestobacter TaxID=2643866 RepID=UPI0033DB97E6